MSRARHMGHSGPPSCRGRPNGPRRSGAAAALVTLLIWAAPGCGDKSSSAPAPPVPAQADSSAKIDLPAPHQRLCTGIAILVDTSGSMSQTVRDRERGKRPKHRIARDALQRIVDYTQSWSASHPDRILLLGMYNFSSSASPILAMGAF